MTCLIGIMTVKKLVLGSGSQSVHLDQRQQRLATCWKCKSLGSTPDPGLQKFRDGLQQSAFEQALQGIMVLA